MQVEAFLLVGLLYLQFMSDIVGLSPALAGTVFLFGKIWDAVSDPLMGGSIRSYKI